MKYPPDVVSAPPQSPRLGGHGLVWPVAWEKENVGSSPNLRRLGFMPSGPESVLPADPALNQTCPQFASTSSFAKLERAPSREREKSMPNPSVFDYTRLWAAPFLAEIVLFLGAIWMMVCLSRLVFVADFRFPLLSVIFPLAVYLGLVQFSSARELWMPRKVVFFGIGGLAFFSLALAGIISVDAFLLGGVRRMGMSLLTSLPLLFFVVRCISVMRAARFTPSLRELARRPEHRPPLFPRLRTYLRFWMN